MVAQLSKRDLLLGLWLSFLTAREIFLRREFDPVSPLLKPSHSFFQHQMKWQFLPLATELPPDSAGTSHAIVALAHGLPVRGKPKERPGEAEQQSHGLSTSAGQHAGDGAESVGFRAANDRVGRGPV